ncbi:AbrB/MazE/SpoVT family DNA-binding domain-containing protein [Metabacillus litoralis]|uniref:AbrB/MazE/SpoVT family DNA-binding domain-containing protein n=1 Tax=Metabacillus TaxID=2675233 RepID=UPI001B93DAAA|nr:AbrB/MazE/SpoVT family DNA-binding domain-containing protein [Metabacillus litoralis]MCM3411393.1 AbrB/MazE/SpoVT family DNA-binding domain-containing protein [Metabacillus litoralis]UHA60452.1 AbrB/MazE/SpoVT family DNA-binding domain-containing protein [Metabacillus litoralis]
MQLTLTKSGQVYLPNCIRKELNLEPGDNIYIFVDNKAIILAKEACEKENQCILSNRGTLHIPVEIRRICKITSALKFNVILNIEDKRIVLSIGDYETEG